jgi:hypothetical protein
MYSCSDVMINCLPDVPQNTSLGFLAVGSGSGEIDGNDAGADDLGAGELVVHDLGNETTRVDITVCVVQVDTTDFP